MTNSLDDKFTFKKTMDGTEGWFRFSPKRLLTIFEGLIFLWKKKSPSPFQTFSLGFSVNGMDMWNNHCNLFDFAWETFHLVCRSWTKVLSFISRLVTALLYYMHRHGPQNQRSGGGSTQQGSSSAEAVIRTAGSGQKINLNLWPRGARQRTQNAASQGWEARSSSTLSWYWWLRMGF